MSTLGMVPISFLTNGYSGHVFRLVRKISKSDCYCVVSVCPSARMEQLGSQWTDFHEIWYFCVFRDSVEKFSFINPLNTELNPICQ